MGRIFEVVNSLDEVEKVNVLFTFCYRGEKYMVYKNRDGDKDSHYGDKVSCNLWQGIRFRYQWGDEAKEIANLIMKKAEEGPFSRPMGEHYEVRRLDDGAYRIRSARRKSGFSQHTTSCADALRFAITMVLAIIYAGLRYSLGVTAWLYALFPHAERKTLLVGFGIFILISTAVIFFLSKKSRSVWNMLLNIILPTEFIVIAAGLRSNSILRTVVSGVIIAVAVGSIIYKLYSKTKPAERRKTMKRNLRSFIGTTSMFVFVLCLMATNLVGVTGVVYTSETRAENYAQLIENYNTACENVRPDVWETLDEQTKVDSLQAICDYECIIELGCDAPQVYIARWDDELLLGEYSHITGELYISQDRFENDEVYEVVSTLLHEVRHAWQHSVIEVFNQIEGELDEKQLALNFFRDAEEFRYNFENYYNGEDFEAYATQRVERDSREWSQRRLEEKYYFCLETE